MHHSETAANLANVVNAETQMKLAKADGHGYATLYVNCASRPAVLYNHNTAVDQAQCNTSNPVLQM